MKDKIINKIKALLSKTKENGATKAEAESAFEKASQLMTQYMINEYEVNEHNKTDCIEHEILLDRRDKNIIELCCSMANLYNCITSYNRYTNIVTYFGFETNIKLCLYTHDIALNALKNELKSFKKSDRYVLLKKSQSATSLIKDFIQGFCEALRMKIHLLKEEQEQNINKSTGTNLIVIETTNVKAEFNKMYPDITSVEEKYRKRREITSQTGYILGAIKGKEINFNKGISTNIHVESLCSNNIGA